MTTLAVILPFTIMLFRGLAAGPSAWDLGAGLVVGLPMVAALLLFVRWGFYAKATDRWLSLGLLIGVGIGIIAGNITPLGEWAIDCLNPRLTYQDHRALFGSITGGFIGAWFGALAGGIASSLFKRKPANGPANAKTEG